jgi:uncharacterized protein DUF642
VNKRLNICAIMIAALAISACSSSAAPPVQGPQPGAAVQIAHKDAARPFITNLVQNGSFELPVVPVGGFTTFSTGSKFSHWVVVGASGNVTIVSGAFTQNGFSFPAKCGQQWMDLTGVSQTATGVRQTIATAPGSGHTLTFAVGNVVNPGGIFGTSSTVIVQINGVKRLTAVNSNGSGQAMMVWKSFSLQFTAPTSSTKIAFINGDPSTDTANGLDCVKLI